MKPLGVSINALARAIAAAADAWTEYKRRKPAG
jgi:hypothetical protein